MLLTLDQSDLAEMPGPLRRDLLAYVEGRWPELWGVASAPSAEQARESGLAADCEFEFVDAPPGSRHKSRRLVSLSPEQAAGFYRMLDREETGNVTYALFTMIDEFLCDGARKSPTDLADLLGLRNNRGDADGRLVSPYLKRITFALRRFTGVEDGHWYTLDSDGMFYLDPDTVAALHASGEVLGEGVSDD